MGWKIDHLYEAGKPVEGEKSRLGWHTKDYIAQVPGHVHLMYRVLDDDGNAMYRIDCNHDDDAYDFLDWAANDVGATILEKRLAGEWVRE